MAAALGSPPEAVQHVGSTAVPGLDAKPTIDILVGVADLAEVDDRAISSMAGIGYEFRGEMGVPGRRYFRKGASYPRDYNVHVVALGGELWRDTLAFRDRLRADEDAARAYAALKRRLVATPEGATVAGYAAGKAGFIAEIVGHGDSDGAPD